MNLARTFILGFALLLFYLMFLKPDSQLFKFALKEAGECRRIVARLLIILRALLAGYCALRFHRHGSKL